MKYMKIFSDWIVLAYRSLGLDKKTHLIKLSQRRFIELTPPMKLLSGGMLVLDK